MALVTDLLFFDEARRMIICTGCKTGVSPGNSKIGRHLLDFHPNISAADRKTMVDTFSATDAIGPEDIDGLTAAREVGYSIHLVFNENGFACGQPGCTYLCSEKHSMVEHLREKHKEETHHPISTGAAIQSLFPKHTRTPGHRWFRVEVPVQQNGGNGMVDKHIDHIMTQYMHRRQLLLSKVPDELPRLTLWDQKTQWLRHFAGLDMNQVTESSQLPKGSSLHPWALLSRATKDLLYQCNQSMAKYSDHVRQIFHSICENLSTRPMKPVQEGTLPAYFAPWQRFVLYLVQNFKEPTRHRLVLSKSQINVLEELDVYLSNLPAEIEDEQRSTLQNLVRKLSHDVLTQLIVQDPYESPLIHFLGVLGWDAKANVWLDPSQYSPTLAQIEYCLRILGADNAFSQPSDRRPTEIARDYWRKYLHHGSDTLFTTVQDLLNFVRPARNNFYAHPSVTWSEDHRSLTYLGRNVNLDLLRIWIRNVEARARELLLTSLVFQEEEYLETCAPINFAENMVWAANGECFYNLNLAKIGPAQQRVAMWARRHKNGQKLCQEHTPQHQDSNQARRQYDKSCEKFLELLFLLVHFTSGLPARGTEVETIKIYNTWNSMRNIFIYQSRVVIITEYNKSEAVMHFPKVIARFLHERVSKLIISYIIDVLPFRMMLNALNDVDPATTLCPLLWHSHGKSWKTVDFSRIMSTESQNHIGIDIHMSDWRQIMIAMSKEIFRDVEDLPDLAEANHSLQAGHTPDTDRRFYAVLDVGALHGTTHETLTAFSHTSDPILWYFFDNNIAESAFPINPRRPKGSSTDTEVLAYVKALQVQVSSIQSTMQKITTIVPVVQYQAQPLMTAVNKTPSIQPALLTPVNKDLMTEVNKEQTIADMHIPPLPTELMTGVNKEQTITDTHNPALPTTDKNLVLSHQPTSLSTPLSPKPSKDRNSIIYTLQLLYGADASFRSDKQERAVTLTASTHSDVIVQLPTASGKSLVISIPAYIDREYTTLVVVPYNTLRRDLIQHCTSRGLDAREYQCSDHGHHPLLFVVPENVATQSFRTYLGELTQKGRLRRIVFDECHLITMESQWRDAWLNMAQILNPVKVQKIYMSATLPLQIFAEVQGIMEIDLEKCYHIHAPTNKGNIMHQVVRVADNKLVDALVSYLDRRRVKGPTKVLICVKYLEDADFLSRKLSIPSCTSKLSKEDQTLLLQEFSTGQVQMIVGTSLVGTGLDLRHVDEVIHYRGSYGLVTYFQQASRAGRGNEPCMSTSIVGNSQLFKPPADSTDDQKALHQFLTTRECQRVILSAYLDGIYYPSCTESDQKCANCRPLSATAVLKELDDFALPTLPANQMQWAFDNTIRGSSSLPPTLRSTCTPSSVTHVSDSQAYISTDTIPSSSMQFSTRNSPQAARTSQLENQLPKTLAKRKLSLHQSIDNMPTAKIPKTVSASISSQFSTQDVSGVTTIRGVELSQRCAGDGFNETALLSATLGSINAKTVIQGAFSITEHEASCINCFLVDFPVMSPHQWRRCPTLSEDGIDVGEEEAKQFRKTMGSTLQRHLHKFHHSCLLPLGLHTPTRFEYRNACPWTDTVRDVMFLSMSSGFYDNVFNFYGINRKEGTSDENMRILSTERKDEYKYTLSLVFAHIVFYCALRNKVLR